MAESSRELLLRAVHFRKLFLRAKFALETLYLYVKPFRSYLALKSIIVKNSTYLVFWGKLHGRYPTTYTFLESSFHLTDNICLIDSLPLSAAVKTL